jgi:hypothetical protein
MKPGTVIIIVCILSYLGITTFLTQQSDTKRAAIQVCKDKFNTAEEVGLCLSKLK